MAEPLAAEDCHVYVIAKKCDDGFSAPCKIGIAGNPRKRVCGIATSCPFPVDLYATIGPLPRAQAGEVERAFHTVMRSSRLHGEWFDIEPRKAAGLVALALSTAFEVHAGARSALPMVLSRGWCADPDTFRMPREMV